MFPPPNVTNVLTKSPSNLQISFPALETLTTEALSAHTSCCSQTNLRTRKKASQPKMNFNIAQYWLNVFKREETKRMKKCLPYLGSEALCIHYLILNFLDLYFLLRNYIKRPQLNNSWIKFVEEIKCNLHSAWCNRSLFSDKVVHSLHFLVLIDFFGRIWRLISSSSFLSFRSLFILENSSTFFIRSNDLSKVSNFVPKF